MIEVNAVDSFCDLKSKETTGNGEKKLYLTVIDSLEFIKKYLGISITNGVNIYQYNDEFRIRTKGLKGYITRENLIDFHENTKIEYGKNDKYRNNLELLKNKNEKFLKSMDKKEYFQIDCSISEGRIYIGSADEKWFCIPSFSIPRISQVRITYLNDIGELYFELII